MIMSNDGITVSELVKRLKDVIDHHSYFNNVTLIGELSNFKAHHSGHFYFTLKDSSSRIQCVMFRSKASSVLFNPKDGDNVIIRGSVEVFESQGTIQLYANSMHLDGQGDLYIQFERLKKDLIEKGWFDPAHKKNLPKYPRKIAVVVGNNSAAYHDIMNTLSKRWPLAEVRYEFAFVQGNEAENSIISKLKLLEDDKDVDVIIIARGGGSIEDLHAFNSLEVVTEVFKCSKPIISGVGHESDITLVDFVADVRAATPTGAAVIATPDMDEIRELIRSYKNNFYIRTRNRIKQSLLSYNLLISKSQLNDPQRYFDKKQMTLDVVHSRIFKQIQHIDSYSSILKSLEERLNQSISKRITQSKITLLKIDSRLYHRPTMTLEKTIANYKQINFRILSIEPLLYRRISSYHQDVTSLNNSIQRDTKRLVLLKKSTLIDIMKYIGSHNPITRLSAIYEKGFAEIVIDGTPINSVDFINPGDTVTIKMKDGSVETLVKGISKHDTNI